jgi:hypothetical protein
MKTNDRERLMNSDCTSFWLKDALKASLNRDILDAIRDAEILADLLTREFNALYGGPTNG